MYTTTKLSIVQQLLLRVMINKLLSVNCSWCTISVPKNKQKNFFFTFYRELQNRVFSSPNIDYTVARLIHVAGTLQKHN